MDAKEKVTKFLTDHSPLPALVLVYVVLMMLFVLVALGLSMR